MPKGSRRTVWVSAVLLALTLARGGQACTLIYTKSSDVPEMGIRLPRCTSFKISGAPIVVPHDTSAIKYGQLQFTSMSSGPMGGGGGGMIGGGGVIGGDPSNPMDPSMGDGGSDVEATFLDRNGVMYPVASGAIPANTTTLDSQATYASQLLVKARLKNGNVTSYTLAMFVPFSTMLKPLRGTSFIGNVTMLNPPDGIPSQQYVRWDFGSTITVSDPSKFGTQLQGYFVNLHNATRHDADGSCQPALCATKNLCAYYSQFFGNSSDMSIYWNPNMHAPQDTELVPAFSSGITYMTHWVYLYQLLNYYNFYQQYEFGIHGNPIGTPNSFIGTLSKTTAKPETCLPPTKGKVNGPASP